MRLFYSSGSRPGATVTSLRRGRPAALPQQPCAAAHDTDQAMPGSRVRLSAPDKTCLRATRMTASIRPARRRRRGATLILICILMIVLMAMVAFAVDTGRMYLVRAEMQSAVDAGALAAALQLRNDPQNLDAAVDVAKDYVQKNHVGWLATVPKDAITVEVGDWNSATSTFTTGGPNPNAVRVLGTSDEPLFFSSVLGHSQFSAPRVAIATGSAKTQDVMMTLDLSGSMGSQGRIQALWDAAPVFVNALEGSGDRIGVAGYGAIPGQYDPAARGDLGTVFTDTPEELFPDDSDWVAVLEAPLTTDFDYLRNTVLSEDNLKANKYNGWTPIGAALRDSAYYLSVNARPGVDRVIVLMSDGHANKPNGNGPGYARDMAHYAASLNIKVYTIALGNAADDDLMKDIADITGAKYFSAGGPANQLGDKLKDAFRNVASEVQRTQLVK